MQPSTPPPRPTWAIRLAWVAAIIVYACLFQGLRPLYSPDEGRYTNVALAMLDSGDWVHPMLHHEVEHWSKPPVTYWAIATSFATFGRSEFAARLPGALAFAGTILLLLRLGRRFTPQRPWLAPLVYATFLFPSIAANLVTTDTLLAFGETLVVVAFLAAYDATDATARRRAGFALGAAAAFAFMTKGPPGLLTLAACIAFVAWNDGRAGLRRLPALPVLATFAVLGLGWFAIVVAQEPGVLRYFLVEEVVNRVASDKLHRNAEWYGALKIYLPTLLLGSLPWLPIVLASAWRGRHGFAARLRDDPQSRLLLCWIALPAVVFFVSRSRLPLYVLPLFVPLAVVVARSLRAHPLSGWRGAALAGWAVLLLAARIVPAYIAVGDDDRRLARDITAAVDPKPAEVAFVEAAPRFGLRFYLGSEIERLELPYDDPRPQAQDLASELAEREGCRLLLVDPDRAAELQAALDAHAMRSFVLPRLGDYVGIAQLTDDCAWTLPPRPPGGSSAHMREAQRIAAH